MLKPFDLFLPLGGTLIFIAVFTTLSMANNCDNLIPNPSFEQFSALPNDDCDWALAQGWTNASNGSTCTTANGTPDYYHINGTGPFSSLPDNYFANVTPFDGDAAMGVLMYNNFFSDAREYISTTFTAALNIGETYTFSFALTLGNPNVPAYAVDRIGALFSVGPVLQPDGTNNPINQAPQFLINETVTNTDWQVFTFTFVADQAYDHITFGNFFPDNNTNLTPLNNPDNFSSAYYFVDDFSLTTDNVDSPAVDLGPDQLICTGTPLVLDATTTGATYQWSTGATTPTITIIGAGTYAVTISDACGTASDEILITEEPTETQAIDESFCAGGSFTLNDQTYTEAGIYSQIIPSGGSNGCDLELVLNLTEDPIETQVIDESICAGSSFTLNDQTYTMGGTYIQTIAGGAADGCDLQLILNLTENTFETETINESFCPGASFTLNDQTYTDSGTYTQMIEGGGTNGCDLQITLILTEDTIQTQTINESFCAGDSFTLNDQTYTVSGIYTQIIEGGGTNGCDLELVLNLTEKDLQIALAASPASIFIGESTQLNTIFSPVTAEALFITWQPSESLSCIDCPNPIASPTISTTYTVSIIDTLACEYESAIDVIVNELPVVNIYIPNAFSPNNDGANDLFLPYFADPSEIQSINTFQVFSRWGELVFSRRDVDPEAIELGWDGSFNGQALETGIYVYQLQITDRWNRTQFLSGDIAIIR